MDVQFINYGIGDSIKRWLFVFVLVFWIGGIEVNYLFVYVISVYGFGIRAGYWFLLFVFYFDLVSVEGIQEVFFE